ncbi:MAG: hypothetical protein AABY18_09065 [Candidatus Thermoplasmatota archaeon]
MRPIALLMLVTLAAGCLDADGAGEPGGSLLDDAGCPVDDFAAVLDVVVPVLNGGGRVGATDRFDVPVALGELVPAGFAWSCVDAVEVRLAWTNGATAGADLYVGLEVPATGLAAVGNDQQQLALDGPHEETVVAAVGWGPHDPAALADGVTVVVFSDWASLSQSGLAATVTLTLLT